MHLIRALTALLPLAISTSATNLRGDQELIEQNRLLSEYRYDIPKGISNFRTVMISGTEDGRLKSTISQGEAKTAWKRRCKLELNDDGDLVTYRKNDEGKYEMIWRSGGEKQKNSQKNSKGEYETTLGIDGNLVTRNIVTDEVVWSTRSQDMDMDRQSQEDYFDIELPPAKYFLMFGYDYRLGEPVHCELNIWRYKEGAPLSENSWLSTSFGLWWSNVHYLNSELPARGYNPMAYVLQKGEILDGGDKAMMLDMDCNLVVFKGQDLSNKGKIIWSSADDGARPNNSDDCHLFARRKNPNDPNDEGEMVLYKGAYKRGITNGYEDRGPRYWERPAKGRAYDGFYDVMVTDNGPVAY